MTEIAVLTKPELEEMLRQAATFAVSNLRDDLERSRTPELMDKKQLAQYLNCGQSKIYYYMKRDLPYEMFGDHPRFRKSSIDSWLQGKQ